MFFKIRTKLYNIFTSIKENYYLNKFIFFLNLLVVFIIIYITYLFLIFFNYDINYFSLGFLFFLYSIFSFIISNSKHIYKKNYVYLNRDYSIWTNIGYFFYNIYLHFFTSPKSELLKRKHPWFKFAYIITSLISFILFFISSTLFNLFLYLILDSLSYSFIFFIDKLLYFEYNYNNIELTLIYLIDYLANDIIIRILIYLFNLWIIIAIYRLYVYILIKIYFKFNLFNSYKATLIYTGLRNIFLDYIVYGYGAYARVILMSLTIEYIKFIGTVFEIYHHIYDCLFLDFVHTFSGNIVIPILKFFFFKISLISLKQWLNLLFYLIMLNLFLIIFFTDHRTVGFLLVCYYKQGYLNKAINFIKNFNKEVWEPVHLDYIKKGEITSPIFIFYATIKDRFRRNISFSQDSIIDMIQSIKISYLKLGFGFDETESFENKDFTHVRRFGNLFAPIEKDHSYFKDEKFILNYITKKGSKSTNSYKAINYIFNKILKDKIYDILRHDSFARDDSLVQKETEDEYFEDLSNIFYWFILDNPIFTYNKTGMFWWLSNRELLKKRYQEDGVYIHSKSACKFLFIRSLKKDGRLDEVLNLPDDAISEEFDNWSSKLNNLDDISFKDFELFVSICKNEYGYPLTVNEYLYIKNNLFKIFSKHEFWIRFLAYWISLTKYISIKEIVHLTCSHHDSLYPWKFSFWVLISSDIFRDYVHTRFNGTGDSTIEYFWQTKFKYLVNKGYLTDKNNLWEEIFIDRYYHYQDDFFFLAPVFGWWENALDRKKIDKIFTVKDYYEWCYKAYGPSEIEKKNDPKSFYVSMFKFETIWKVNIYTFARFKNGNLWFDELDELDSNNPEWFDELDFNNPKWFEGLDFKNPEWFDKLDFSNPEWHEGLEVKE